MSIPDRLAPFSDRLTGTGLDLSGFLKRHGKDKSATLVRLLVLEILRLRRELHEAHTGGS